MILSIALQAVQAPETAQGLTTFAWVFMLSSMGAVTALTVWCFSRILGKKEHFDPDGTGPARPPVQGEVEQR